MLIRKFIITAIFGLSLLVSIPINATEKEKDKVLLSILKYVLTQGHYHPQQMNDTFSERVFNEFIDRLDPSKRYFLQSDIEEFSEYKFLIDDQIKSEDLTFFFLVHERYIQRFNEGKVYFEEILATEFNFDKKETLDVDYDLKKFAKSKPQLIQNWLKQLKFSALSRIHDKVSDEEAKKEEDKKYISKTFKELEIEAREASLTNMNDFYSRMLELTPADWFSVYLNCITEDFDPHTTYYSPSDKKRFDISMAGKLEGIGARLTKKNDYTKVSEIISGGPAWKQGELEPEDLILKVAQEDEEEPVDIVGMRLDDAIEYIKGKKGTKVRLTVKKVDGTIKEIIIIRDVVELEETFVKSSVVKKDGKKLGVINLPKFYIDFDEKNYRNSATDMEQEIKRLKEENVEGLVIDLRNNGGGSLKTAIEITGLFIDKGPVVQVKYRGDDAKVKSDGDSKVIWNGPLVVLVNELSASASEIFAAAMQDYGRAIVIGGKQTYGKGTVQSVLDLNRYTNLDEDLGALKMTIQKFYRINGSSTQLEGVKSDVMLPSRYSYMDIGERDLAQALQFDEVPQANYNLWNHYDNFESVINNSKKRVSHSNQFKLIDQNAKWLKKSQDDSIIYLNYKEYIKDLDYHKKVSEKYKAISEYTTNLRFTSPLYEQNLIEADVDLKEKRERWHKNLKTDVYIEEALSVVAELKIKPNYLLVKN